MVKLVTLAATLELAFLNKFQLTLNHALFELNGSGQVGIIEKNSLCVQIYEE
jgi:hypothetical protein